MARLYCLTLVCALGCGTAPSEDPGDDVLLRPRSQPIEFVGMTFTRDIVGEEDLLEVVDPIFGTAAQAGTLHTRYELDRGVFISSSEDPRTDEQVVITIEMQPTDDSPARVILRVPASFEYGRLYIETVRAALATTAERTADDPDGMQPWELNYHSMSANGGYLKIRVAYENGAAQLSVQTESPRTSLRVGEVNTAALRNAPQEMIGGTVNFTLSRDEFDFFSSRAYGVSNGRDQNFEDFLLLPHEWLRITVTPMVEDGLVDVAFDVVLLDGSRVALARAPASYVAGEQFRQNVFRMIQNMRDQELEEPGSSRPFVVPFHYDDPEGGGVVRVIATGGGGRFGIAYAVDSPVQSLREVDFVPFLGDPIPTQPPPPPSTCEDHGSMPAEIGHFIVTFDASDTVRNSENLTDPLIGTVYGSVFRAEDVTISGPRDGATSVADFTFENVDITAGPSASTYVIDTQLPAGEYQILGTIDIDRNSTGGEPDVGDPVTLPIGGYDMACAEQPVIVEFALLLPEGV